MDKKDKVRGILRDHTNTSYRDLDICVNVSETLDFVSNFLLKNTSVLRHTCYLSVGLHFGTEGITSETVFLQVSM